MLQRDSGLDQNNKKISTLGQDAKKKLQHSPKCVRSSPKGAQVAPYSENAFHEGLSVHNSQPQNILKLKIAPLGN